MYVPILSEEYFRTGLTFSLPSEVEAFGKEHKIEPLKMKPEDIATICYTSVGSHHFVTKDIFSYVERNRVRPEIHRERALLLANLGQCGRGHNTVSLLEDTGVVGISGRESSDAQRRV